MVARNGLPAKNLPELIDVLKANSQKLTLGTAGPGSGQHVSGIYFQSATGTTLRFVPYRAGSSDIMKDLVGGHIDLTFDQARASEATFGIMDFRIRGKFALYSHDAAVGNTDVSDFV